MNDHIPRENGSPCKSPPLQNGFNRLSLNMNALSQTDSAKDTLDAAMSLLRESPMCRHAAFETLGDLICVCYKAECIRGSSDIDPEAVEKAPSIVESILCHLYPFVDSNPYWQAEICLWLLATIAQICRISEETQADGNNPSKIVDLLFRFCFDNCIQRLGDEIARPIIIKASLDNFPVLLDFAVKACSTNVKDALDRVASFRHYNGAFLLAHLLEGFLASQSADAIEWIRAHPSNLSKNFNLHSTLMILFVFVEVKGSLELCIDQLTDSDVLIRIARHIDMNVNAKSQQQIIGYLLNISHGFDGDSISFLKHLVSLAYGREPIKFVESILNGMLSQMQTCIFTPGISNFENTLVDNGFLRCLCDDENSLTSMISSIIGEYWSCENKRRCEQFLQRLTLFVSICNRSTVRLTLQFILHDRIKHAANICQSLFILNAMNPFPMVSDRLLRHGHFDKFARFLIQCRLKDRPFTNCFQCGPEIIHWALQLTSKSLCDKPICDSIIGALNTMGWDTITTTEFNDWDYHTKLTDFIVTLIDQTLALRDVSERQISNLTFFIYEAAVKIATIPFCRFLLTQEIVHKLTRKTSIKSCAESDQSDDEIEPIFKPKTNVRRTIRKSSIQDCINKKNCFDRQLFFYSLLTSLVAHHGAKDPDISSFIRHFVGNILSDPRDRLLLDFVKLDRCKLVQRTAIVYRISADAPIVIDIVELCLCHIRLKTRELKMISPIVYYLLMYISVFLQSQPGNPTMNKINPWIVDTLTRLIRSLSLIKAICPPLGNSHMMLAYLNSYDCHIVVDACIDYLKDTNWPSAPPSASDPLERTKYEDTLWYVAVKSISRIGSQLIQSVFFS